MKLRLERSWRSISGWLRKSWRRVGIARRWVTRWRAMAENVWTGSGAWRMTAVLPATQPESRRRAGKGLMGGEGDGRAPGDPARVREAGREGARGGVEESHIARPPLGDGDPGEHRRLGGGKGVDDPFGPPRGARGVEGLGGI